LVQVTRLHKFILHFSLKDTNNIYFIFVAEWPREGATNDEGFDTPDLNDESDPNTLCATVTPHVKKTLIKVISN
jgi:hypothetical protein